MIWGGFKAFWGGKSGIRRFFMLGVDRARRAHPGTSLGTLLDAEETIWGGFY